MYNVKRAKWRGKAANAVRKGIEFSIPFSEIDWPTHCPVLGIELNYESDGRCEESISFSRPDSSKGYVSGNVRIISWRANRIKNDGSSEEHRLIAKYMEEDDTITKQRSFNTVN